MRHNCKLSFLCIFRSTIMVVQQRKTDEPDCHLPKKMKKSSEKFPNIKIQREWCKLSSEITEKPFLHQPNWVSRIRCVRFKSALSAYLRQRGFHFPSEGTRSRWRTRGRNFERMAGLRLRPILPRSTFPPERRGATQTRYQRLIIRSKKQLPTT